MAKNDNLKDYLTDLYEGIKSKNPNASRNPQNFRIDIESIETGINTSDATATANDILLGKTAYVNDEKIEGTIETYDGENEECQVVESSLKKYLDIKQSCKGMFENTAITDATEIFSFSDTENVTNMSSMFSGCTKLTAVPQLDTHLVTSMSSMFNTCVKLTTIPQLDTHLVTSMSSMFSDCNNLTTIPQLDTSSVTDMYRMFNSCSKLKTIPQLDTHLVTDMSSMFSGCTKLTAVPQLDTHLVTSMSSMFSGCTKLTTIPQLDTSSCTNLSRVIMSCTELKKLDITHYNISSSSNGQYMCGSCYSLKALIIRNIGNNYLLGTGALSNCYHINGTTNSSYNPNGDKDGYIYVPRNMVDTLKSATNWSTYGDQIRALEDYTKDGTTTGEFDNAKAGLV